MFLKQCKFFNYLIIHVLNCSELSVLLIREKMIQSLNLFFSALNFVINVQFNVFQFSFVSFIVSESSYNKYDSTTLWYNIIV